MLVYSLRVRHILQHHFAHLQRAFSEPDLENLQIPTLLFVVSIRDHQKTLSEEDLELLNEEVLRIIDADKRADDIAWLVRSEVWTSVDGLGLPVWICVVINLSALEWLNGFIIIN